MTDYNPFSLSGKTILVTGASSGIGRGAAIECSKLGANVILTARNEERLKDTYRQLGKGEHQIIRCDLTSQEQIAELVRQLPKLDGVINNAGLTRILPIPFLDLDALDGIYMINTIAPILVIKHLLKNKKLKKGASIVFTSSTAGIARVTEGNSMYASSKGALNAFVRAAARELSHKGIRVNAVCPGMVDTGILNDGSISVEQIEKDKLRYPLKRYGKPEDIAWAMIYLLSDASSWVTGTNLVIDGGILLV